MPYCPLCQREPDTPDSRCSLDRAFYVRSSCPRCGGEVFPKERHCAGCGARLEGSAPRVAAPLEPASVPARMAAFLLDGITLFLLVEIVVHLGWLDGLPPSVGLPLAGVLVGLVYFTGLQAGAGQTLGQHVMGQVVLTEDRQPLPLARSAARTLLAALSWPVLLPLRALAQRDRRTAAEAWTGSRTWYDRRG